MQIINLMFYFLLSVLSLPSQSCISLTAHLNTNRLHMKCRTANIARGHPTEWRRPNQVSLLDFAFEFQSAWSKVSSIHYGDERAPEPQSFLAPESEPLQTSVWSLNQPTDKQVIFFPSILLCLHPFKSQGLPGSFLPHPFLLAYRFFKSIDFT